MLSGSLLLFRRTKSWRRWNNLSTSGTAFLLQLFLFTSIAGTSNFVSLQIKTSEKLKWQKSSTGHFPGKRKWKLIVSTTLSFTLRLNFFINKYMIFEICTATWIPLMSSCENENEKFLLLKMGISKPSTLLTCQSSVCAWKKIAKLQLNWISHKTNGRNIQRKLKWL